VLHVLLTNDDGILAPGLRAIAMQLAPHARVTVIAPDSPRSACSHSITLHKPLRLIEHGDFAPEQPNLTAYECSGTPADCVTLALHHVCKGDLPHFVVSGINDGPNLGEDLIYSGTVAGALEGSLQGVPGMAVSLMNTHNANFADAALLTEYILCRLLYGHGFKRHKAVAEALHQFAADAVWQSGELLEDALLPQPQGAWPAGVVRIPCFNVNIPDLALGALSGIRWAGLGHREYKDVVVTSADPRGKPVYWIWGERVVPPQAEDSDIRATSEGYISVTPIQGDLLNLTDLPLYAAQFATE
jgi:5'-nucleotidase